MFIGSGSPFDVFSRQDKILRTRLFGGKDVIAFLPVEIEFERGGFPQFLDGLRGVEIGFVAFPGETGRSPVYW